jgi:hypothetical protein
VAGADRIRYVAACPEGHVDDLQLRRPCDFAVRKELRGPYVEADFRRGTPDEEADGEVGVTCGVWCPACEQWFDEEDCVHEADENGQPILLDPGPAKGDEDVTTA